MSCSTWWRWPSSSPHRRPPAAQQPARPRSAATYATSSRTPTAARAPRRLSANTNKRVPTANNGAARQPRTVLWSELLFCCMKFELKRFIWFCKVLGDSSVIRQCAKEVHKSGTECYKTAGKSTQYVCTCKGSAEGEPCNNARNHKFSFVAVGLSVLIAAFFY